MAESFLEGVVTERKPGDRKPGDKKAEELFKEVSEAYRALSNPQHKSVCGRNRGRN